MSTAARARAASHVVQITRRLSLTSIVGDAPTPTKGNTQASVLRAPWRTDDVNFSSRSSTARWASSTRGTTAAKKLRSEASDSYTSRDPDRAASSRKKTSGKVPRPRPETHKGGWAAELQRSTTGVSARHDNRRNGSELQSREVGAGLLTPPSEFVATRASAVAVGSVIGLDTASRWKGDSRGQDGGAKQAEQGHPAHYRRAQQRRPTQGANTWPQSSPRANGRSDTNRNDEWATRRSQHPSKDARGATTSRSSPTTSTSRESGPSPGLGRYSLIGTGGAIGYAQATIMRRLKRAKSRRDGDEAKRVLDEALSRPDAAHVVDVFVYSAVLGVLTKTGDWQAALEIMSKMRVNGIHPNEFTYNQAITACGNGGQWRWAIYLLKAMSTSGVKPNVISYNAAIAACGVGDQPELALVLLREMPHAGIEPNATSYGAAMSAALPSRRSSSNDGASSPDFSSWNHCAGLLKEMRGKGVKPDAACYRSALAACCASDQTEEAVKLLQLMREDMGALPDSESYHVAIAACERLGEWERAVVLLRQMQEAKGGTVSAAPDNTVYRSVINACTAGGQSHLAEELSKEMYEKHPNTDPSNTIPSTNQVTT